jgi:GrpB-like predicted nucleotidyltransferase (UPF0157 family)
LRIEHAGSTAVPGLEAKPIIDIVLAVTDSADEAAYAPARELQAIGSTSERPTGMNIGCSKGPTQT